MDSHDNSTPAPLARPPIVEALIDVRVAPRADLTFEQLQQLQDALGREEFPSASPQVSSTIQLDVPAGQLRTNNEAIGVLFRSADQLQVVQAQRTGFAFSQLAPYRGWTDLVANARLRWGQYREFTRPDGVTRLAARYINRIGIPGPITSLQDWIPKFPDLPEELPQTVAQVVCRMVVPIPSTSIQVIVTQAIDPSASTDKVVTLVFDLDVFQPGRWPTDGEDIWLALEKFRPIKNAFFHKSLSERTLELFR